MSNPALLDCEAVLRVIFAYVDGELSGADHAQVDAHIARCRSCFSRAEFESRLKGHLAGLAGEPVSPVFERRIQRLVGGLADHRGEGRGDRPPEPRTIGSDT